MSRAVRRLAAAAGWTVLALAIALGSAGLVAGLDHRPGTAARAELTWAADEAIRPGLDAASADLATLADEVARLGLHGRTALAALTARDLALVDSSVADGSALVADIDASSAALGRRLGALPGVGAGMAGRLGQDVRVTYGEIVTALGATTDLAGSWATLTAGSDAASRLVDLLAAHDTAAAEAARLGSAASYPAALARLDLATGDLDRARELRDQLANAADVSVLDEWIARNRAMDVALRRLYVALRDSHGTVTAEVRVAVAEEQAAQASLPPDTRALVVIMSDLARGGLNQAVIAIEVARGRLADAVTRLTAEAAPPTP